MTVYGGFSPGTYQAWALNLLPSVFLTPGIARALSVTQNTPADMTVQVTVDPVAGDGICYLANGAFLRIDAQASLNVPSNTSGVTRTDAVVAQVDPTGLTLPNLSYITNWASGIGGGSTSQLVLALVSVPNNATSIVSGDITVTSARANFNASGNASSINNVLFATNNTNNNAVTVTPVQITSQFEGFIVEVWNGSSLTPVIGIGTSGNSTFSYFTLGGDLVLQGGNFPKVFGLNGCSIEYGSNVNGNITMRPGAGNIVQIAASSGSTSFDTFGNLQGPASLLLNQATTTGQRWFISNTQPTNATVGDVWIRTDTTLT